MQINPVDGDSRKVCKRTTRTRGLKNIILRNIEGKLDVMK